MVESGLFTFFSRLAQAYIDNSMKMKKNVYRPSDISCWDCNL